MTDNPTTSLLQQLAAHRATLAILLRQLASLGADYAPPGVHNGIVEARAQIARLKAALRDAGAAVEDQAGDVPSPAVGGTPPVGGRQHTQTIDGHAQVGVAISGDFHGTLHVHAPEAPAPPPDEELLPSLQPPAELPDLFPIANDLIGHAAERSQLSDWYDALATERRGRFAFITGRPGFGKRALLNALVDDVRAAGGPVLQARFWPTGRADADTVATLWDDDPLLDPADAALEPQIRAAWPLAARIGGRGWVRVMAQLARVLDRLSMPGACLPDDPTTLTALVRQAARPAGLLLAIEALDDADDVWIELLRDLAPEIARDLPVLVLATLTLPAPLHVLADPHMTETRHLVKTLQAQGRAEVLWLDIVTPRDVAAYVGDIDAELARRLVAIGDGVPAIVEALWAAWAAEGVVARDAAMCGRSPMPGAAGCSASCAICRVAC